MKIGHIGMTLGALALLLALISFWAGPFSPQPTIESVVAEKAAAIKNATMQALAGKDVSEIHTARWTIDKIINVIIPTLGGLAFILAVFSFVQREPRRLAGGAAVLGISAILFQFIAMAVMALIVVALIISVLTTMDFG